MLKRAYIGWAVIAGAAAGYEGWLIASHQSTLSEAVWHGPLWFQIVMAIGLGLLIWHFFIQPRFFKSDPASRAR